MFIGWGVFGMVQVVSTRYLRAYWKVNMWLHRISGTIILLVTIALGIVGIKMADWELTGETPHTVIGLIILFATFFVAVGGVFARSRARRLEWKTIVIHRVRGIHKFAGRIMIILGQVAILTGVLNYNDNNSTKSPLGIIDIVVFFVIIFITETFY
jgi:hypothetical protein